MDYNKLTLSEIKEMKSISTSHTDQLLIETAETRVWVSRMTVACGMPYDFQVTIEHLNTSIGKWETVNQYEPEAI